MAYGDPMWQTYPWGNTTDNTTFTATQWGYSSGSSTPYPMVQYPMAQPWAYIRQMEEGPPQIPASESPLEWLRRRVEEITDLAYAEV